MKTKIQELRKKSKLSQEELAVAVGVTRQTITSLECEKYTASLVLAYKIAKYFNTAIENVFDFSEIGDFKQEDKMLSSIIGISFDCPDANELADFYVRMSGWEKEISSDEWAGIRTPQGILLVFQTVDNYVPPVWPWENEKQQQMAHIDFKVDNLKEAVEYALKCGARESDVQYYDTSTVMFDPAGHPFCLSTVQQ